MLKWDGVKMPNYKSFTDAIKDLFIPLDKIGDTVVKSIQTMIETNSTPGKDLHPNWKARKTQNTNTKLLHTGEMLRATKFATDKNSVSIGYDNKGSTHKPDSGKGVMTNAGMAQVHNEGNDKGLYRIPARPFLFANGQWDATHKKAVENFIQNYYKNKGII
jgi:phage gpG-like protein